VVTSRKISFKSHQGTKLPVNPTTQVTNTNVSSLPTPPREQDNVQNDDSLFEFDEDLVLAATTRRPRFSKSHAIDQIDPYYESDEDDRQDQEDDNDDDFHEDSDDGDHDEDDSDFPDDWISEMILVTSTSRSSSPVRSSRSPLRFFEETAIENDESSIIERLLNSDRGTEQVLSVTVVADTDVTATSQESGATKAADAAASETVSSLLTSSHQGRTKKHDGKDKTGIPYARSRNVNEINEIINEGLYAYEDMLRKEKERKSKRKMVHSKKNRNPIFVYQRRRQGSPRRIKCL